MGNNRAFMGKERQHFLLFFKDITGGGRDKETGTTGVCFNCVNHLSFTTDYNNRKLPWEERKRIVFAYCLAQGNITTTTTT